MHVFIHGGAGRFGRSADAAYLAETFVDAGAYFIDLDFQNVIKADGNLVDHGRPGAPRCRLGPWPCCHVRWRSQSTVPVGRASGAHLASVVLTTDWRQAFGLPADTVRAGLCCGGLYDLQPVSLSACSSYVAFSTQTIEALSAMRHLDKLTAPMVVAYGTLETPEFQRQSREFAAALKAAGKAVTLIVGEGYNHFEMHETQGNPYGLLGRPRGGRWDWGSTSESAPPSGAASSGRGATTTPPAPSPRSLHKALNSAQISCSIRRRRYL